MGLEKVRSRARAEAWRVTDGEPNYNPFARMHGRKSSSNDVERGSPRSPRSPQSAIHHAESLPVRSPLGRDEEAEIGGPTRAQTSPATTGEKSIDREVGSGEHERDISGETSGSTQNGAVKFTGRDETSGDGLVNRRKKFSPMRMVDNMKKRNAKYEPIPVVQQFKAAVLGSWINVLLILVPVGFALEYSHSNPIAVFCVNFVAIIPLAGMLAFSTEELAKYCGENLGGLLNATFGNAVELIVSIIALLQNKVIIVQTSLIGSMLSNLLLVLGMAFYLGGWNRHEQHFNQAVAQSSPSLLVIAIGSLILPTAFHEFTGEGGQPVKETPEQKAAILRKLNVGVDELSRGTAIILLFVYASYLTFQLRTHKTLFDEKAPKSAKKAKAEKGLKVGEGDASKEVVNIARGSVVATTPEAGTAENLTDLHADEEDDDDDGDEPPSVSIVGAIVSLLASTVLVAFCSEFMVSGIDYIVEVGGISEVFVGLILIPIVGNAAEHATAVTVAIKDKLSLSLSVAIGSSLQIALFVLPIMVCLGWWIPVEGMSLWFDGFQTTALFVSVLLVNYLIQDNKSNWLEGLLLICLYFIIAIAAWFTPAPGEPEGSSSTRG